MMPARRYVALGDSISIDAYPGQDHCDRVGGAHPFVGLGAVSLFHRNHDAVWPAFRGRDLATLRPGAVLQDETQDGATTHAVIELQLPNVRPMTEPLLVTLTAGGNDLLAMVGMGQEAGEASLSALVARMRDILEAIEQRCPNAVVLLGTVYDPTDGSGRLDHVQLRAQDMAWLACFNDAVRSMCKGPVRLVDIHRHFLGHGLSAAPAERWYWSRSCIEPGVVGANEVRRLWLEAAGLS